MAIERKHIPSMNIPSKHKRSTRVLAKFVVVCFLWVILQPLAYSGIISTETLLGQNVGQQVESTDKKHLRQLLDREDIRLALIDMGVSPDDARQRITLLSDQEAKQFAADMEELPAGSGALETLVLVFLVLLFTDIMGYTDIFPFVVKGKVNRNRSNSNNSSSHKTNTSRTSYKSL